MTSEYAAAASPDIPSSPNATTSCSGSAGQPSSSANLPGFAPPEESATSTTQTSSTVVNNEESTTASKVGSIASKVGSAISSAIAAATAAPPEMKDASAKPKSILKGGAVAEKAAATKKVDGKVKGWCDPAQGKSHVTMPKPKPSEAELAVEHAALEVEAEAPESVAEVVEVTVETASPAAAVATVVVAASPAVARSPSLIVASKNPNDRRGRKVAAKSVLSCVSIRPDPTVGKRIESRTAAGTKRKAAAEATAAPAAKKKAKPAETAAAKKKAAEAAAPKKKATPAKKTAVASPKTKAATPSGAKEIWSGVPTEEVIGVDWTGWTKKTFLRKTGKSKDSYWYSPVENYKLRSHNEVKRFITHLDNMEGDEDAAYKLFKGK